MQFNINIVNSQTMLSNMKDIPHIQDSELLGLSVIGDFTEGVKGFIKEKNINPKSAIVSAKLLELTFPDKVDDKINKLQTYGVTLSKLPQILRNSVSANINIVNLILPYFEILPLDYFSLVHQN